MLRVLIFIYLLGKFCTKSFKLYPMLSLFMMLSSHDLLTFITETGRICNNTNINALHMPSDLYIFEVAANQNQFITQHFCIVLNGQGSLVRRFTSLKFH